MRFAAIDFETANHSRDSACAVGLVIVDGPRIVDRLHQLIRPPTDEFVFTHIHGLMWRDVRSAPTFAEWWPDLARRLGTVEFLAAHNAPFDSSVLAGCCRTYRLPPVHRPFVCTVQVSRQVWNIRPTRLPEVCARLRIPLRHHEADSDAAACARIVMAARAVGWTPSHASPRTD